MFSRKLPIVNLKGMGIGSRVISSAAEMDHHYEAGHMWMPLMTGEHVSTDCAIEDGRMAWCRHATGVPWHNGAFPLVDGACRNLPCSRGQAHPMGSRAVCNTGMLNFETIGGTIIEAHLRFADQWCDLYGEGWIEALVRLYAESRWHFDDSTRQDGFSVPLFTRMAAPSAIRRQNCRPTCARCRR